MNLTQTNMFAFVLFGLFTYARSIDTMSFCSTTSLRGRYSPMTIDGSSNAITAGADIRGSTSVSCKCRIQTFLDIDIGMISITLNTNYRLKECGKWIEVVKDREDFAHRFHCNNGTTDIVGGTGITATLFVDTFLESNATYQLDIRTDVSSVEFVISCSAPTLGQATLPTASVSTTSTTSTSTTTSSLTSTAVPHVISTGNNNTVILVAVMVAVSVIVVAFIIGILICISRRMNERLSELDETPAVPPRVFKRIGTRITHLYDSIKETGILPNRQGPRGLGTSTPMPLPKRKLEINPSGLYDSIRSNPVTRVGTRGNKHITSQTLPTHLNSKLNPHDAVNKTVAKVPVTVQDSTASDKYYIHAGTIGGRGGTSRVAENYHQSADVPPRQQNKENAAKTLDTSLNNHDQVEHVDDSTYVSMDGNIESENDYLNPILKSKSVKYINHHDAKSMSSDMKDKQHINNDRGDTLTVENGDVDVYANQHQKSLEDTSIYVPMDNFTKGKDESEVSIHLTNDDAHRGNAIAKPNECSVANIDSKSTEHIDNDDHCYTNTLVNNNNSR